MHVIAVVSQKGGSGKTTLTGHLSVQADMNGQGPIAIIDTDPQGSLAAWWNERVSETPLFIKTTLLDLPLHLKHLSDAGIKTVFIDTPPAITGAIQDVIKIADYILVPTKPSPHDLRAVGATVQLVQACNKPMVFILNDASSRAKITYEAAIALSQHGTVAPVTIHHRTLFASSMIDGRTAQELEPKGLSAVEIHGLWEYVNAKLNSIVMPTTIGLDAAHRHDGQGSIKQAFAPPKIEAETASLATIASPSKPPISTTEPPVLSPKPNDQNLWKGFAEEPESLDQDLKSAEPGGRPNKVFGRRSVNSPV